LVYFENCQSLEEAIIREKQLKGSSRTKKIALINKENPDWSDLSEGWLFDV
jgi:putative endonuclease